MKINVIFWPIRVDRQQSWTLYWHLLVRTKHHTKAKVPCCWDVWSCDNPEPVYTKTQTAFSSFHVYVSLSISVYIRCPYFNYCVHCIAKHLCYYWAGFGEG